MEGEKLTIAHYLVQALKELDPPTDWNDIVPYVLATFGFPRNEKFHIKKLTQALEVGLRFGIIREMNNKYYLYEYAKIRSCGNIKYDFTPNPLCAVKEAESSSDDLDDIMACSIKEEKAESVLKEG